MHDEFELKREKMVKALEEQGITDVGILKAMRATRRHFFVPPFLHQQAYALQTLSLEGQQTITSPYVVALMIEAAKLSPTSKVLEIGTGSGYQTSILSKLCHKVCTIEIIPALARHAAEVFKVMKLANISSKIGDGYIGWQSEAPFDVIIVTAACKNPPSNLIKQLKVGGRMIIPLEEHDHTQKLAVLTKKSAANNYTTQKIAPVSFLSMTGLVCY